MLHLFEEIVDSSRNEPLVFPLFNDGDRHSTLIGLVLVALHSESLARASLSIGENCRMVPLYSMFNNALFKGNVGIMKAILTSTTCLTRSETQTRS